MNFEDNVNQFKEKGYCIAKDVLPDFLKSFISQYALFDEMRNFSPEKNDSIDHAQVPDAHSKYADPAMETLLLRLLPVMEKNTGLQLYPTYSYYRIYRNGDSLKIHRDRPSCEISATLCFDYSYDDTKFSWPIYMNGFCADLKPGDMVIYRGCELDHWREKFIHDIPSWHVQGFFHYVDSNGPYADRKFDRRNSIGQLSNQKFQSKNQKSYVTYTN